VDSFGDHRTAMSFVVAGLVASGQTKITDTACIDTSFPSFKATLKQLI
jgi:3-phosphoshikimate 1-carboxyvinyltransferase